MTNKLEMYKCEKFAETLLKCCFNLYVLRTANDFVDVPFFVKKGLTNFEVRTGVYYTYDR